MGSVQAGSAQGQGDEAQGNLRRQLGVEKRFGYTLMFYFPLHVVAEGFLQLYIRICAQPSVL